MPLAFLEKAVGSRNHTTEGQLGAIDTDLDASAFQVTRVGVAGGKPTG